MKSGQSTLEYAVVIIVLSAALVAMLIYLKRGVQGRLRSEADQIGQSYSPGNTESAFTVSRESEITTEVTSKVVDKTEEKDDQTFEFEQLESETVITTVSDTESRYGYENVGELKESLF